MSRRRALRPVGSALADVLEGAEPATLLAAVQSAWAAAVGEAIAREATPVAERDGVVTVSCESATWAQELDLLGGRIRVQVGERLPDPTALRGFRFTASGTRRDV